MAHGTSSRSITKTRKYENTKESRTGRKGAERPFAFAPKVIPPHRSLSVPFRSFRGQFFLLSAQNLASSKSHPDALKAGPRSFPPTVDPSYHPPLSDTLMTSVRVADFVHARDRKSTEGGDRFGLPALRRVLTVSCGSVPFVDNPLLFLPRVSASSQLRSTGREMREETYQPDAPARGVPKPETELLLARWVGIGRRPGSPDT